MGGSGRKVWDTKACTMVRVQRRGSKPEQGGQLRYAGETSGSRNRMRKADRDGDANGLYLRCYAVRSR